MNPLTHSFRTLALTTISLLFVYLTPTFADHDFDRAKTVLTQKCLSCHSGDEPKGKLDVTSREKILAGGDSGPAIADRLEASGLWNRVDHDEMPPKKPLTAEEKQALRDWIAGGAKWTGEPLDPLAVSTEHRAGLDWWSLQSLKQVSIPRISSSTIRQQAIDDFILEMLIANQLTMSPEADRRVLIRRLSFDLRGLPPAPEEVDEFVRDTQPDANERLVDRLLASPHYGERWARHWLDVVRFGESNGFERDLPRPHAWPYRDWIVEALNRDLPYDEFVRWQLAGDLFSSDPSEAMKSAGFLVAGAHDTVVPVVDRMRAMMRQDELEDLVGTVCQTFLGLTVNCARCHDHKFDPITSREYYQIASALSGVDHGEREFTPARVTQQLTEWQSRIDELATQLREQETPLRAAILAERTASNSRPTANLSMPKPLAEWDFTQDLNDRVGAMHAKLIGSATRTNEGLVLDGKSFARTGRLTKNILEKTLEVRVRIRGLDQGGGGVMTVQTLEGTTFDSIVFAEQEPRRWLAGSEGFQRTLPFQGPEEIRAEREPVLITQVYQADGTIQAYRNGQPYGVPIRKSDAVPFGASTTQIVFGLRHGTEAGGNRMLSGTIINARLYDRALSAEEVAISADSSNTYVSESEILSKLAADDQRIREAKHDELKSLKQQHAATKKEGLLHFYTAITTQPSPMKIHQRGSVSALGDEVAPAGISAIRGRTAEFGLRPDAIEGHRRRELANWITDARNPLFSRVMANRVWHYHFGAGLVESPNDLGFHAGQPSHPELLDWLSYQLQAGQFSLKRLHRLLVTSTTYRQSSALNENASRRDANNRLLWRVSPRRLEAEELRDSMLLIAGQLNSQLGGKSYLDTNSYFFKGTQFYDPIDPVGHENHRRTLYRMWARSGRSPFLDNFDCPDPSTTTPRRSATVTPLQALSLLNHSFTLRMADSFASRLNLEAENNMQAQVERAYQLLFGRTAESDEVESGQRFITRRGLSEFCRAMWSSSEFLFLD